MVATACICSMTIVPLWGAHSISNRRDEERIERPDDLYTVHTESMHILPAHGRVEPPVNIYLGTLVKDSYTAYCVPRPSLSPSNAPGPLSRATYSEAYLQSPGL
jgi:hypothetical protein